jgi:hypothetical protein
MQSALIILTLPPHFPSLLYFPPHPRSWCPFCFNLSRPILQGCRFLDVWSVVHWSLDYFPGATLSEKTLFSFSGPNNCQYCHGFFYWLFPPISIRFLHILLVRSQSLPFLLFLSQEHNSFLIFRQFITSGFIAVFFFFPALCHFAFLSVSRLNLINILF